MDNNIKRKKKILIVEDEQIIALNIKLSLQKFGYKIIGIAGTADKAIQFAKENLPDLILMDINLNDYIDGIEVANIIQKFADTAIIFLTSYTDTPTFNRARLIGPFGYLIKPFKDAEMFSTIEMALFKFSIEKRIRESEEKHKRMIANISDVIAIMDKNEIIRYYSPNIEKWFGWGAEELIGTNGLEMVHPDDIVRIRKEFYSIIELDNMSKTSEFRMKCKDGSYKQIGLTAVNLSRDSSINGILMNYHDITERKKTEKELSVYRNQLEELVKARTEELEKVNKSLSVEIQKEKEIEMMLQKSLEKAKELNELKTRFISTTSHEFRTPLASIQLSSGLLQRYVNKWPPERLNEHFNRIDKSIDSLTNLLDRVLTLSRAESGKIQPAQRYFDLEKLCQSVIEETNLYKIPGHNFTFIFKPKQAVFFIDPDLMHYILSNLLVNAFKYSPQGGEINLIVKYFRNSLNIVVEDAGIGIPMEDIPYLFEPFHRGANIGNISGSGLGLSIVQKTVEMLSGKIEVNSIEKQGTTFKVMIPTLKKE